MCYWLYWVSDNTWGWVECVTDWNMLLTLLGYWQYLGMTGMCYWLTDNSWGWVECVTGWNMLLTILGYWQYLGMSGMCYWLKYITDFTGLLTILGDDWNVLLTYWVTDNTWGWLECVTGWNILLTVLDYWQYLGMSGMCYWLKYVTDCTGLLTILGYEWNVLLTYWVTDNTWGLVECVTGWNMLLTVLGYWNFSVAECTWFTEWIIVLTGQGY